MKKIIKITTMMMATTAMFACSKSSTTNDLQKTVDQNEDGALTRYKLVDGSRVKKAQGEPTDRTNLVELPIDSKYNAHVFYNNDQTEESNKNAAFIAPNLFAYGTQQGGQVVVRKNQNGNITISFNITFVDGMLKKFKDSKAINDIDVPNSFQVHDQEGLKSVLLRTHGINENKIGALSGCPKQITINYAGREYDVTPSRFLNGNVCEFTPFTVSVTLNSKDARDFLYQQLPNGMIDVGAVYETKSAKPLVKADVKFDRQKIFDELKASLKTNWFVDVDAKTAITSVAQNQMMNVRIQGDPKENLKSLIEKITNEFFIPLIPNPKNPEEIKCEKIVCLQFNQSKISQNDQMDFSYEYESNQMFGYSYITSTKLKSSFQASVTLGKDAACVEDCGRVVTDANYFPTGLSLSKGTWVNIKPEVLIRTKLKSDKVEEHVDHPKCAITYLHAAGLTVNQCNSLWHIPSGGTGATICNSCAAGAGNDWIETTYYNNVVSSEVNGNPGMQTLEDLQLVFKGIDESSTSVKTIACPLYLFKMINNGDSLSVLVDDSNGCAPFKTINSRASLSVVNAKLFGPVNYLDGKYVRNWSGAVSEMPVERVFFKSEELQLTIGVEEDDPYGLK